VELRLLAYLIGQQRHSATVIRHALSMLTHHVMAWAIAMCPSKSQDSAMVR
jgi:hypothetical protein